MPYKDKNKAKEHSKEYGRKWYQQHKEKVIERKKQQQKQILEWFRKYKSTLECMDCGMKHPAVLCFHHRDPKDKDFTISKIITRASSIKKIQNEIEQCDVVCINCHAKRHWRETHETDSWEEVVELEEG